MIEMMRELYILPALVEAIPLLKEAAESDFSLRSK
jgi:hypothetical protein